MVREICGPKIKKKVKKNSNNIEEVLVVSISTTGKTVGPGRIAYFQCIGWLAGWLAYIAEVLYIYML